jgi:PKD repeat protein
MRKKFYLLAGLLAFASMSFAQTSGGPDAFGYTWKDNNASGGPSYDWIDITGFGTKVTGLADDNFKGPYSIGFNFNYYWTTPSKFYIGSNGYVSFDKGIQISSGSPFAFNDIPTATDNQHNFLAPFLSDMNFGGAGNPAECYYWTNNTDTLIISFLELPFWNQAMDWQGDNSFQIIINGQDNSIRFQYQNQQGVYDPAYNTLTNPIIIGIENINGQIGLQHSAGAFPNPPYAVLFDYPDSITYSIVDLSPDWLNNVDNAGFFLLNGIPQIIDASISNVGNTSVGKAIDVNTNISGGGFNQTFTVGGLAQGASAMFSYGPTWTPSAVGNYDAATRTILTDDLIPDNDTVHTEIVVIDTAGNSSITLSFTDTLADQTFGFMGAAVRYVPPFHPVDIESVTFAMSDADTFSASNNIIVEIFDDQGAGGTPGALLFDSTIAANDVITVDAAGQFHELTLPSPLNLTTGGFFVSWRIDTAPQNTRILTDITPPFSIRTYEVLSGVIAPYRSATTEDIFIWATVSVPPPNTSSPPVAAFGATSLTGCVGDNITFYSHATTATSQVWTFPSGTPGSSMNTSETVSWSAAGTYTVKLVATNSNGSDSTTMDVTITALPVAAFSASDDTVNVGENVTFTNSSTNYQGSSWTFGDGGNSGMDNPTYAYNTSGTYTVTLVASNACNNDQATTTIVVLDTISGIASRQQLEFKLFPNPASDRIQVVSTRPVERVIIYDLVGKQVFSKLYSKGRTDVAIELSDLSSGLYMIKVFGDGISRSEPFTRVE